MKTKLVIPILLPTKDIHSQLEIEDLSIGKLSYELKQYYCKNPQQLILISLDPDEKIEEGDLFERGGEINVCYKVHEIDIEFKTSKDSVYCGRNTFWDKKYCHKVIATQEQLSPEYIKQFIEEYNNNIVKDIEIEMIKSWDTSIEEIDIDPIIDSTFEYKPKLTNGFITIVNKEPILYTEEEVDEIKGDFIHLFFADNYGKLSNIGITSQFIREWIKERK